MKKNENNSFKELENKSNMANREDPQQQPDCGTPVSSTSSLLGQPDVTTPGFGQTTLDQGTSTFGQTHGFGLPVQQQSSPFGKPTGSTPLFSLQQHTSGFEHLTIPANRFVKSYAQSSLVGQQQSPQTPDLFQTPSNTLFGGSSASGGQKASGTVIKFSPVCGTDIILRYGKKYTINTKYHSITCMKEYENKSCEELRYEHYMANRKGPRQQPGFATTPSLFGRPDATKPAFGQKKTTFGQGTSTIGFSLPVQQQQSNIFGKSTASGVLNPFGIGPSFQNAKPLGSTQANPSDTTASLFGSDTNTTPSGFGTGPIGQTNKQNTPLFAKPAYSTTGFGEAQAGLFVFSSPAPVEMPTSFGQWKSQSLRQNEFGTTTGFENTRDSPFGSTVGKLAIPAFGVTQTLNSSNISSTGRQHQSSSLSGIATNSFNMQPHPQQTMSLQEALKELNNYRRSRLKVIAN